MALVVVRPGTVEVHPTQVVIGAQWHGVSVMVANSHTGEFQEQLPWVDSFLQSALIEARKAKHV